MFKLFSRGLKRSFNHFVALDIGTEFVKALNVELIEGKKGEVRGYATKRLALGDLQSSAITDIGNIIQVANLAIEEANKMAGTVPQQLILGVAGELVKGSTITLSYKRNDPTAKINQSELKNIIHKIQWKAFEQLRSNLSYETGFNEIDIKLINAAIVDVAIDGYKVANPIGFQGKNVELTIFNAFSPIFHYGAIQTITAELNHELLAITAEPYALAKSISRDKEDFLDCVIIDVGSATTDIALLSNGSLVNSKMFTLGGRLFTKRISQSLNISFREAEEIKLAYSNDQLEKQSGTIIKQAIQDDAEIWLSGITLSLSELSGSSLPGQILLCGGACMLPEIKEILESREWTRGLPFTKKPRISFIKPEDIISIRDSGKSLTSGQMITPLALASTALELAGEEKLLQKLLQKVIRLMQV